MKMSLQKNKNKQLLFWKFIQTIAAHGIDTVNSSDEGFGNSSSLIHTELKEALTEFLLTNEPTEVNSKSNERQSGRTTRNCIRIISTAMERPGGKIRIPKDAVLVIGRILESIELEGFRIIEECNEHYLICNYQFNKENVGIDDE